MNGNPVRAEHASPPPTSAPAGLRQLLDRESGHPASRLLRPPAPVRTIAAGLALLLPTLLLLLLVLPWQQAAIGTGRVIAYAQQEREQLVESPISGRIERWLVQEGDQVEVGDPLIELRDNDPNLLDRLSETRELAERQLAASREQVGSYERKLVAEGAARDLQVAEYNSKIKQLESKRAGIVYELKTETDQAVRTDELAKTGVVSQRAAELQRLKSNKAQAELEANQAEIMAARQALGKARADGDAKVAEVEADLQAAQVKLDEQQQKLLDAQVKVSRQQNQLVRAPRSGAVLRLHGGPGGGQVKSGDMLLTLVPEAGARAVELSVEGNDMPLVREGEQVRLLFEGWPALQFVGFPGADAGTYAGRVAFVDATDDGSGKFRIVVVPDENEHEWPDAKRLRQGVRARGWILFGTVSLGYELWRQLNGFPPLPPVEKGDTSVLPTTTNKKPRAPDQLK
ncbi:MAG: HlyD family efflux transporter periplasmic adaptor subunit [Myxococcota bacterium]